MQRNHDTLTAIEHSYHPAKITPAFEQIHL